MVLKPATGLGRWSVWLLATFAVGLTGLMLAISAGQKGGDTFTDNWLLAGPGLVVAASGIGAFVTGLIAMVHEGERSPAVMLATLVGLLVTLFVVLEIAFPH